MENYQLSKYNIFKREKEKTIGVNLFDTRLFAISNQDYKRILENKDCLTKLKENDPVLFDTMYKLGVIETDNTDIPAILLLRNRTAVFSDKNHRLIILPTLNCNFSCWYCYETHTKMMMLSDTVCNIIEYIKTLIYERRISSLHLDWFGGEPLLGFDKIIKPIAVEAKKMCEDKEVNFWMTMTTNGFLIKESMIPFFKEHNLNVFQITLDGNEEQHNKVRYYGKQKKGSYATIVNNIGLLAKNNIEVQLRINYTKDMLDTISDIIPFFSQNIRKNILLALAQVWQDRKNNAVNGDIWLLEKEKEIYNLFEKAGFSVSHPKIGLGKSYSCYADSMTTAVINYDGRVFKCTTPDFENEQEDGILTEKGISWDENRIAHRLAKATFDKKICFKCLYLPVCSGGCSTHQFEITNKCHFKQYLKAKISTSIKKFDEENYKIAYLSQV
ncbi:MAG: radical SAM protein [Candidatus Azobacteroides sp.]|nr:radical SAM protein [Candidatus Azobacteroides sp.]